MSDLKSVAEAIEASNKSFEAFVEKQNERFEQLENAHARLSRPGISGASDTKAAGSPEEKMHLEAFTKYVKLGVEYDRSQFESKSMSLGSAADGGFALPKVISDAIDATAVNISPIRQIARVQQIGTSDFHKLVNTHGTASGWMSESQARPATSTPQLVDVAPPMGELYANPQATQQMLDDVFFNAEQWLAGEVGTEFARAEGAAFVVGTGVNQPKGFLSYPSVSTDDGARAFGSLQYVPTGVSGNWAASNPADTLLTLVFKLKAAYRAGAVWVVPKALLAELTGFKDSGGRYIFAPMSAPNIPATIFGYPVVEAEDMPARAANSTSIAFGNFDLGYLITDRMGARVIRDPFSNKPYVGFYSTKRLGGGVINSEAIKLLKFSVS